jgi:TATA-box binding protein (TBP) (component of TFIID and TFIIIB)
MVLTGCKSYIECIDCALQVVVLMRENMRSTTCTLQSVKVQNMVGNVVLQLKQRSVQYELRLDDMHRENSIYCTYQRKMFPGLIYRPENSPIVLLVFHSGKIVVTGGKSVNDMWQGWAQLWGFVLRYVGRVETPALTGSPAAHSAAAEHSTAAAHSAHLAPGPPHTASGEAVTATAS